MAAALIESLTQTVLLSREVCVWIMQEYTDDTAELRKQLDALGGMAALQDPETQLLALQDLEQFVSAVCHLCSAVRVVHACSKFLLTEKQRDLYQLCATPTMLSHAECCQDQLRQVIELEHVAWAATHFAICSLMLCCAEATLQSIEKVS